MTRARSGFFSGLAVSLVVFVMVVLFSAVVISVVTVHLLHVVGVVDAPTAAFEEGPEESPVVWLLFVVLCLLLGLALAVLFSRRALTPIHQVVEAMHQVASGDYAVRVDLKGIRELEELSESFNKMTQELASTETLRSDFVNDFSHELKTPIHSLRGFAQLLSDGDLSEDERQEYLRIIVAESDRLARLSTNVLALSKYEHIEILAERSPFRLDEQIRRVIVLAEPAWSSRQVDFHVDLDDITFVGNEDLLEQVWVNLVDNAVKFSQPGGEVRVQAVRRDGGVQVQISDEGIGMDAATQARIFDKFYQGDPSRAASGTGLGLAIVRRVLDVHRGTAEVHSEPGAGTTVTLWLPDDPR